MQKRDQLQEAPVQIIWEQVSQAKELTAVIFYIREDRNEGRDMRS